jgi:hypothetical protein
MTLLSRISVLAVKTETTPGTAESVDATNAALNVMDADMTATIPVSVRPIQGSFRKLEGVPGARQAACTFTLELVGDGAGGVPAWATTLLAACGVVNSAGVLTPRNEVPGANVKTVTLALYENGRRKLMYGASGNVVFTINPGAAVMMAFTFTGVWGGVTDATILAPTYPTTIPIRASSGAFTINSVVQTFATATFDVGNVVTVRPSIATATGFDYAVITDRTPMFTIDPEAKLVATTDVFGDWQAGTTRALSMNIENATDNVAIAAPAVQRMTVTNGDREGLRVDSQTLQCCRSGTDAEFSITFAAA